MRSGSTCEWWISKPKDSATEMMVPELRTAVTGWLIKYVLGRAISSRASVCNSVSNNPRSETRPKYSPTRTKSPVLNGLVIRSKMPAIKFATMVVDEKAMMPEISSPISPSSRSRNASLTGKTIMERMRPRTNNPRIMIWRGNFRSLPSSGCLPMRNQCEPRRATPDTITTQRRGQNKIIDSNRWFQSFINNACA